MKIKLNSNRSIVKEVTEELRDNNGFCPCQVPESDNDSSIKCICDYFKYKMQLGECLCGLYVKY